MAARSSRRWLAVLALVALALPPASAQTIARFAPALPDGTGGLELRYVRERAGRSEPEPWPAREIGWLFVREEGTQRNFDALAPSPEDATRLRVECSGTGAALVGWDLPPRIERTTPADLRAFLAEHASELTLPREIEALPASEPVPVMRLESLALVAPSTEARGPSAIAISKSGQRMELRALMDPSFLAAGSDFAFKLYAPRGGSENLHVRAVHLDTSGPEPRATRAVERLADGSLRTNLDRAGPWVVEAVRVRAVEASSGAVLELASASLVFTVRPAGEKGGKR